MSKVGQSESDDIFVSGVNGNGKELTIMVIPMEK